MFLEWAWFYLRKYSWSYCGGGLPPSWSSCQWVNEHWDNEVTLMHRVQEPFWGMVGGWGISGWWWWWSTSDPPVDSLHNGPLIHKAFPCHNVLKENKRQTPAGTLAKIADDGCRMLTHWGRDKWPPVSRRHCKIYFLEWKCMTFDWNFTWFCSWGSN